jgi:hypothetical protein
MVDQAASPSLVSRETKQPVRLLGDVSRETTPVEAKSGR